MPSRFSRFSSFSSPSGNPGCVSISCRINREFPNNFFYLRIRLYWYESESDIASRWIHRESNLGPVYTECHSQRCDNSAMILVSLFSLRTMELLEKGLQPHSGVTPLFLMRIVSLASLQNFRSIDSV